MTLPSSQGFLKVRGLALYTPKMIKPCIRQSRTELEITHKSPIRLSTGRKEVEWEFESSEEDRPGAEHTLDTI